jgi:membrane-bound lytic murein transglycosylase A
VCGLASQAPDAKAFFETLFLPVIFAPEDTALFTGYFEPEIAASPRQAPGYTVPIYRVPPDLPARGLWYTRAELETGSMLKDRGLEIAWARDPVEVFFLQVQGSGRLRMPDGTVRRIGFGAKNGHEYRSIGRELVRRGLFEPHQVSAQVIQNWVRQNPEDGRLLLHHNPSFVFFREVDEVPPDRGPLGAMNRSITEGRSIAVDPAYTPLGAPVWIEKEGQGPIRRLMIAQDTGSAIKGPQRADIFFGTGDQAGRQAGRVRDAGRMVTLLPIEMALRLTGAR